MIFRNVLAVLGLAAAILSTSAQENPTVPATRSVSKIISPAPALATPTPVAISAEKLTDAREIARALANGNARVIVMLSPPAALAKTDFASRASLAALRSEIKRLQQDVLDQIPANHVKVGHRFDNIAGFSAEVSPDGLKALQAHPQVVSIEPVFVLQPHLAQGIPLMRGMTYRSTYNGAGLAIAICDSGVDYNHPRLGGGGFPNSKVLGGYDFGDNDADPIPSGEAHGTACAGIAAGDLGTVGDYIGGVAYNAKLYALKITSGPGGTATTADMVAAWDWCVTHKDDNASFPIMVISTSFGGGQYFATCDSAAPSMTTAANNAVAAGITVLASSGNDGYCDSLAWPSCISSVISVSAVYDASFGHYYPCIDADSCAPKISTTGCATGWYADDTTAADKVTSYANVASFLTLFAPGNQCYTLDITGSAGYSSGDYFSEFGGTSAACPYAAGAVACLQSAAKALTGNYLTPQQVRSRLTSLGDNITDTKVAITKPRVNLERVIQSLGTNPVLNVVSATLIGGNGDQSVDPNECNDLRVVLRNDGLSAATNISAMLSASTPGVSVVQQTSAYPNLAAAATRTNVTLFRISTSPSLVCGAPINLTLVVTYGGGTNTNSFSLISGSTNYVITQSGGASIVPGTTDIGNHGDNTTTTISLPFACTFYGQTFSSATISANGNLQFIGAANSSANSCLPVSGFTDSIFAFWDNLRTDGAVGTAQGIYTSTSGTSPNRVFNIEWRASYYHPGRQGDPVNFEVRLYENLSRFDLVYGTLNGDGSSATVGAQKSSAGPFTQFECNAGALTSGLQLAFETICADGGGGCGLPVANFAGSPTNGAAPLTVSFTNLSSGAISYAWDFGDGQTSATANPSHIYTNAGSYNVKLIAINATGTNTLTRTNYIVVSTPPPVASFTANVTNGAVPLAATFSNFSTGATNYSWDFGDGKTSSATNPANTYTNAGAYTVKLTAIGAGGTNTLTRTNYIVATNVPPAIAAPPQNQIVTAGANAAFSVTATGTSPLSYQWRFQGANISGATAASFTRTNAQCADAAGYDVIVTNLAGSVTSSVAVLTVVAPPLIALQPQSLTVTQGQSAAWVVSATNACGNGLIYHWRFNGTNIAGATSSSFIRTNVQCADAGSYDVAVTNLAGSVTSSVAVLTVITPPSIAAQPQSQMVAPGDSVTFSVLATNDCGSLSYQWRFNAADVSGATDSSYTRTNLQCADAGDYTVVVTNAAGSITSSVANLTIIAAPIIAAQPTNQTVIQGQDAIFVVTATNQCGGGLTYQWLFNDTNIAGATASSFTRTNAYFADAGSYWVVVSNLSGSVTSAIAILTVIPPVPAVGFAANPTSGLGPLTVYFTNLSSGATSYSWDFGDGNSSTNENPANTFINIGSYTVSLTASGEGGTNSLTRTNYIVITNPPPPVVDFAAEPTNGVAPLTVFFTNMTSGAAGFSWDFGDGNASTNEQPANTFTNAGSYTVTLTAFGAGGTNSLVRSNYIVVINPPPPVVPDFAAEPTNGVAPLTVYFTNLSSGATSYVWDFGDGQTNTAEHPANIYTNAGSYTVTLTAVGAGGTNALTRTNYIVVIARAQLVVTPASLDFGLIPTGATTQAALVVSNAGTATLEGTAAIADGPFAILSGMDFSLGQSGATNVVINFSPMTAGAFSNVVVFTSTGGVLTNAIMGRAAGAPVIVWLTLSGSDFAFSFETAPGLAYVVQYKDFLNDPAWRTLQSVPGDGMMKTITNSISTPSRRFYRLLVQ